MPTISVTSRQVAPQIEALMQRRVAEGGSRVGAVLVSQAQRRIRNGGDSEHKYPELWATKHGIGYRAGGQPLRDTGMLLKSLSSRHERRHGALSVSLIDGSGYGVYHQDGFSTTGPNFIPLSRRGARAGSYATAKADGLVPGTDYIMAWQGVTVPQRKIFNMPPENASEIRSTVARIMRGS